MSDNSQLNDIFKTGGALAEAIQGFSERTQQLEMAIAIESAIKENKQLVAEAGHGYGQNICLFGASIAFWRQSDYLDWHENAARPIV